MIHKDLLSHNDNPLQEISDMFNESRENATINPALQPGIYMNQVTYDKMLARIHELMPVTKMIGANSIKKFEGVQIFIRSWLKDDQVMTIKSKSDVS